MVNRVHRSLASTGALVACLVTTTAYAQVPGYAPPPPVYAPPPAAPPGYAPPGATVPGYAPPPAFPPPQPGYPYMPPPVGPMPPNGAMPGFVPQGSGARPTSSAGELGFLYGTALAWGLGTGTWIDAEAGLCDEGATCDPVEVAIAPIVLGTAAPVSVFLVDRFAFARGMPEGLPSSIAAGMWIGAGEAMGIASYQHVTSDAADEWGYRGVARAAFIGSTVGGVAGVGLHYALHPTPQTNSLLLSSTVWGTSIGALFGGGASSGAWGQANDSVWLGGQLGFHIGLAGALGASFAWTPTWRQLAWMWGGFGAGAIAATPFYLIYVARDDLDPRRGLIIQGVTSAVGLGLGAIFGRPRPGDMTASDDGTDFMRASRTRPIAFGGAGLMPVQGGVGFQAHGVLW
jgi:hypothetical protein